MGKSKEILVVTSYYPPEKGAASNRLFSLVKGLSENDYSVTVVCPLPNYPHGIVFNDLKSSFFYKKKETYGTIYRLWIWPSNSENKFIRMLSMLSYSLSLSLFFILKRLPNKIIVQYSPVFVGFTSVFWGRIFGKKVILNVSDIWPLAGLEMGLLKKGFYYSLLTKMEGFCYSGSKLILGQSKEILAHIERFGVNKPLFLYRNFPEFTPPNIEDLPKVDGNIKLVYAGLLGVAQGLFKICSSISFPEKVSLHIYGTGPEAGKIKELNASNVYYHDEIEREELHEKLQDYQLGFVPLTNRIYGSVPSKIFELSRLGLPVLYFAGGEGEDIVKNNKLGWIVPVNNINALQNFIADLGVEKLKTFPKKEIQNNALDCFNFSEQFLRFINELENI
jgi:glycosyltransferase involved in cell wall biosynthesis